MYQLNPWPGRERREVPHPVRGLPSWKCLRTPGLRPRPPPGALAESPASRRLPGTPGREIDGRQRGKKPVHQQWGRELGALTQVTSGLCKKSSMSSETVTSMLRLRPPAPRPGPPRRGTKRLWQRAAGAGLRRLAPGRQRRGASPRSAASAAPRPARGWGKGRARHSGRNNAGGSPAPRRP